MGSVILVWPGVEGLEGDGAVHSNAGMASLGIVPALDPLGDSIGQLVAGLPCFRVEQFELHRAPERFHHGIVIAVPDGAHGSEEAGGAQALTEDPRSILRTVIGVQYRMLIVGLFIGLAADDGHAQGIGNEFGAHVLGNRPANDQSGIDIHHRCAIQDAFHRGVLGDIRDPQLIWLGGGEVPVDQIRTGCCVRVTDRAAVASSPVEALDTGLAHQSGDPLEVHRQPQPERQFGMDPR